MFKDDSFIVKIEHPINLNLMKCLLHVNDHKLYSHKQNDGIGFTRSRLYLVSTKTKEVYTTTYYTSKELKNIMKHLKD